MGEGAVRSGHATVISRFRNERFMLPFWLRHHRRIFHHGILIDDGSTDGSADIARAICPGWEVRRIEADFDCEAIDRLFVEEVEPSAPGWKIVLSTIEFLFVEDIAAWLKGTAGLHGFNRAIGLGSIVMADPEAGRPLDPGGDLPAQRYHGRIDADLWRGLRFIHPFPAARYACIGRHMSDDPHAEVGWPRILHYAYSPWPESRARRAAVKARMMLRDKLVGNGYQHLFEPEQYEMLWRAEAAVARDLRENPEFRATWEALYR